MHTTKREKSTVFFLGWRKTLFILLLFFRRASLLVFFLLKSVKWRTNLLITFHRKISPCNLTFAHRLKHTHTLERQNETARLWEREISAYQSCFSGFVLYGVACVRIQLGRIRSQKSIDYTSLNVRVPFVPIATPFTFAKVKYCTAERRQ